MTFKSSLKLDSPIFSTEKRKAAGGRAVMKTARAFKDSTRRKMVESNPSGRIYRKTSGVGFTRSHQASRRGERPAVESGNLARSGKVKRISPVETEVSIGENLPYTEKLVKSGRVIVSNQDLKEAQRELDQNALSELRGLIK
jgi:hypothetical protein